MSYVEYGSIITLHSAGKDQRRDKTPKVIDFTLEEQEEITENPGPSRPNQTEQPSTGMMKYRSYCNCYTSGSPGVKAQDELQGFVDMLSLNLKHLKF